MSSSMTWTFALQWKLSIVGTSDIQTILITSGRGGALVQVVDVALTTEFNYICISTYKITCMIASLEMWIGS